MAMWTISKTAGDAGVTPDTLRYYERVGLLAPPDRSASGYRIYDSSTVERVRLIKAAQHLGLSLDSIRELVVMLDRGACPCGHTSDVATRRVNEIDAEIDRLRSLRDGLVALIHGLADCPAPPDGVCWCETVLRQTATTPKGGATQ